MIKKIYITAMNKLIITLIVFLLFATSSCKKEHFEHQPINFSFADSIAGTYVGVRMKRAYQSYPEIYDTISVKVIDKRTNQLCKFYLECFDQEVILSENKSYKTSWRYRTDAGGYEFAQVNVALSCFQGDTLFYTESYRDKYNLYDTYRLKLIKQP